MRCDESVCAIVLKNSYYTDVVISVRPPAVVVRTSVYKQTEKLRICDT